MNLTTFLALPLIFTCDPVSAIELAWIVQAYSILTLLYIRWSFRGWRVSCERYLGPFSNPLLAYNFRVRDWRQMEVSHQNEVVVLGELVEHHATVYMVMCWNLPLGVVLESAGLMADLFLMYEEEFPHLPGGDEGRMWRLIEHHVGGLLVCIHALHSGLLCDEALAPAVRTFYLTGVLSLSVSLLSKVLDPDWNSGMLFIATVYTLWGNVIGRLYTPLVMISAVSEKEGFWVYFAGWLLITFFNVDTVFLLCTKMLDRMERYREMVVRETPKKVVEAESRTQDIGVMSPAL